MNILETVLNAQNGGAAAQLGRQFGIGEAQAKSVLEQLVPALSGGLKHNISQPGGIDDLTAALERQDHARYYDNPASLERQDTVDDGNAILGHILGSKEVSREVASRASKNTGIDGSILKKMLPVIAALVMGSMTRAGNGGGLAQAGQSAEGGIGGLLSSFLDVDKDGSMVDDLLGMAGRLMR